VRDAGLIGELLADGIERVVIGSAAVERPAEVAAWLKHFGPEHLCLAFDVRLDSKEVPRLQTRGWRESTAQALWDAIERFAPAGLRHVLCTDIERDGALQGPNVALYAEAQRRFPAVQWQASGGIARGADLTALAATGVAAAISGKALLEERISIEELRPFLPNA
jgi:phosphoribosylformimino-5-aminoimidazole carboxamide ribotide isomerase